MPATPMATSVVPWRNGRPNESLTITATSRPVRSRSAARIRRALASGSSGQQDDRARLGRVRVVDAGRGADEAVAGLGDDERRPRAHDARRLAQDDLDLARVAPVRPARAPAATASTSSIRTTRPSAFETAFCATTTTSPSSSCGAPAISAPRSSPSSISGRPSTGTIEITADAADADAGVAPCSGGSGSRSPPSGPRACARSRAGPASSARPATSFAGQLERELLRVGVVAADERVLVGRLGGEVRGRDRVQARRRPARRRRSWIALGERARVGVGPHAVLREAEHARDREQRRRRRARRRPRAPCRARPSALTASTARSAPRTASSLVAPRRTPPSSAAVARRALGVARADHDLVLAERDEPRRERAAEAARCRRGSRPSRGRAGGVEHVLGEPAPRVGVAHQRPRHDRRARPPAARPARRPRRARARRSGPGSSRRRAPATCRRRAARACGRPGPSPPGRRSAG